MAHHDTSHATDGLAAQHKTAVGMVNRIVLNNNILTTIGRRLGLVVATLHAESVVTGIYGAIDNQSDVDVAEVNGITVLGVPGTAHRHAVDNDILTVQRMDMELG